MIADHVRTGSGVFLSGTSVGTLFASIITQSNITWVIGILSGLSAVVMLIFSYKQHLREKAQAVENKKLSDAQLDYIKKKTKLLGLDKNNNDEELID